MYIFSNDHIFALQTQLNVSSSILSQLTSSGLWLPLGTCVYIRYVPSPPLSVAYCNRKSATVTVTATVTVYSPPPLFRARVPCCHASQVGPVSELGPFLRIHRQVTRVFRGRFALTRHDEREARYAQRTSPARGQISGPDLGGQIHTSKYVVLLQLGTEDKRSGLFSEFCRIQACGFCIYFCIYFRKISLNIIIVGF